MRKHTRILAAAMTIVEAIVIISLTVLERNMASSGHGNE